MSAPSGWNAFYELLAYERKTLAELSNAAQVLTQALVAGKPEDIEAANRQLEGRRTVHLAAKEARVALQRKGFGDRSLEGVCAYAPPALRSRLVAFVRDLQIRVRSLEITIDNNKALILSGLERLDKIATVLHNAGTESTGTYRRRGVRKPSDGSVLVSRRA